MPQVGQSLGGTLLHPGEGRGGGLPGAASSQGEKGDTAPGKVSPIQRGLFPPNPQGPPQSPSLAMTFPRHPPPSATDQAPDGPRPLSPSLCPRAVPRSRGLYSPFLLPCPPYPYPCPLVLSGSALCQVWSLLFHIWTLCNLYGHAGDGDLRVASETLFVSLWWGGCVATCTDRCVWHVGLLCFGATVQCSRGLTCRSTCYLPITGMHRMFVCRASWWLVEGHGGVGLKGWGIVRTRFNLLAFSLTPGFQESQSLLFCASYYASE